MIKSKDRSFYIGASDTSYVVGDWTTKTFEKWYGTKLGIYSTDYKNVSMIAGTYLEHRILDALRIRDLQKDKQVISGRLRINLDGNTQDTIYEVKTYNIDKGFKVSKQYRNQVNVEMYGTGLRKAYIVAYGLERADYNNFYRDIDSERLSLHEIEYDEDFINTDYLPRLAVLCECLEKGAFPVWSEQKAI